MLNKMSKTPVIRNGKLLAATDDNLVRVADPAKYNVPTVFPRKLALLTAKTYVSLAKVDQLHSVSRVEKESQESPRRLDETDLANLQYERDSNASESSSEMMDCPDSPASDGSSSVDMTLKKISSRLFASAKLSIEKQKSTQLPTIFDSETQNVSPLKIDEDMKLIDLSSENWPDLCTQCFNCMQ